MARNKPLGKKKRLIRANKLSWAVPIWVYAKTRVGGRTFRYHNRRRNWRRGRLKI